MSTGLVKIYPTSTKKSDLYHQTPVFCLFFFRNETYRIPNVPEVLLIPGLVWICQLPAASHDELV